MAFDEKRKQVDETGSYTKFGRNDDHGKTAGMEEVLSGANQTDVTGRAGVYGTIGEGAGIHADDRQTQGATDMQAHGSATPFQLPQYGTDVEQPGGKEGMENQASGISEAQVKKIGVEQIAKARQTLMKYKSGKTMLERRIIASEQWWKMRHWAWMQNQGNHLDTPYTSAWLFNSIINRHADAISSYPQSNILPREPGDKQTAAMLSAIVPCILEQNDFEEVYSEVCWQKLKQGTGCYGVFWDKAKLQGLGDISIKKIDILNLFWEPGITDIQESRNVFHVELMDNDLLEQHYPELKGKVGTNDIALSKYLYDDSVDTTDKTAVIDWYYHTYNGDQKVLQYCKFVNDVVLYASEDDTEVPMEQRQVQIGMDMTTGQPAMQQQQIPVGRPIASEGWYAHGEYPFILDALFPVEGTPCGFGYVDVSKSAQEQIDVLNQAIIKNAIVNATPRYFVREDGGINEKEFADITKPFVHVNSNLGEDTIRSIDAGTIHGNYITILNNKITELKETSNNTDSSNGITSGVTAASGIAAQQEAAGKTSRAATMSAYRAFSRLVRQVIELIRQFYDVPRQFRIVGDGGNEQFTSFDNSGMKPQAQGVDFGVDMGFRKPVFDVKVSAQSKTVYTQNSQNELAIALANLGVFDPNNVDRSLLLLDAMDFDGKERIEQQISKAGTMQQMFAQVAQIALALAQQTGNEMLAQQLAQIIMQRQGVQPGIATGAVDPSKMNGETAATAIDVGGGNTTGEVTSVRNARERAAKRGTMDE